MADSTTSAAAAKKSKAALAKILRQRNNENTPKFFAAGIVGMIVIFMIFHWSRFFIKRSESKGVSSGPLRVAASISRTARRVLLRKVPGFTSAGHALFFLGYFATIISIVFVNIDWTSLNGFAKRLGWTALSSLVLVTFLSLKNTPLAYLATYSYERLNILHQVAGYSTVVLVLLHAVVYITAWSKSGNLYELQETANIVGITAGFAFLVILGTALFLRRLQYEIFYIIHVVMFMFILVLVGMHRPDFAKKTVIVVIFTASIWVADRALRFAKIVFFSIGNTATVTALPHGATRVVLKKSWGQAVAGSHCFLWIPGVRAAETHPFTIVSTNPLEFVIASYDGFTGDLHAYALKHPGKAFKASIDGPYGVVPDFTSFTKLIFIAGGSGASFSLGVAADIVGKLGDSANVSIEVIWVLREREMLEWFAKELRMLQSSPLVTLYVHSTRNASGSPFNISASRSSLASLQDIEKPPLSAKDASYAAIVSSSLETDVENRPNIIEESPLHGLSIQPGRPDVAHLIKSTVERAGKHDRIAIAACGPDSLMQVTRKTVANCITKDGPSLELFLEQFGY